MCIRDSIAMVTGEGCKACDFYVNSHCVKTEDVDGKRIECCYTLGEDYVQWKRITNSRTASEIRGQRADLIIVDDLFEESLNETYGRGIVEDLMVNVLALKVYEDYQRSNKLLDFISSHFK